MQFIDLKAQYRSLKDSIDGRIKQVLEHGQFIMGPEIAEVEQRLASYVGLPHCISVSSGTTSLEIALRALDIGPGDEVITVPFTWISTAEVISLVGATPVFVDIEPDTYNLDPSLLEERITSRTKAIIPVSLFGQVADLERIVEIASIRALPVIEDGAQSFGALRNGKRSCGMTTISSTSFFPAKTLGCYGDGGALFTDDNELATKMRAIRTHGGVARHHHTLVGTNGRFDTLQAAILLAKLDNFDWEVSRRNSLGAQLTERLKDCCATPTIAPGNTHVYGQYTVRVKNRDAVGTFLKSAGVPSAVYYPKCLHEQPVFSHLNYRMGDFPNSEQASQQVLSLPMHPYLTEAEIEKIEEALKHATATVSA